MCVVSLPRTLTDIIVFVALPELFAQREGSVALEFLRKPLGAVQGIWLVALPPDLLLRARFAGLVLLLLHQV